MTRKITKSNQSEQRSDRGAKRSDRGGTHGGGAGLHPYAQMSCYNLLSESSMYLIPYANSLKYTHSLGN